MYLFITSLHAECDAPVTLAKGDFRMTAMLFFYTTKKSLQFVHFYKNLLMACIWENYNT